MIYRFQHHLKSVIWGGSKLQKFMGLPQTDEPIGESWELSGVPGHQSVVVGGDEDGLTLDQLVAKHRERLVGKHVYEKYGNLFPLLVKLIDAKRDLSVQVHPDDALAAKRHNSLGKTEMWYVFETEPGAKIHAGLKRSITPEQYEQLVADKQIMSVVADHEAQPGDVFFLPAGRIHAIGGGIVLAEIQETSDITYRVYDYDRRDADGKPRQLHTAEARDAIDYAVYPDYRTQYDHQAAVATLVDCDIFTVKRLKINGEHAIGMPADSFAIIMCIEGECAVNGEHICQGTTVLASADTPSLDISGEAVLLMANC